MCKKYVLSRAAKIACLTFLKHKENFKLINCRCMIVVMRISRSWVVLIFWRITWNKNWILFYLYSQILLLLLRLCFKFLGRTFCQHPHSTNFTFLKNKKRKLNFLLKKRGTCAMSGQHQNSKLILFNTFLTNLVYYF